MSQDDPNDPVPEVGMENPRVVNIDDIMQGDRQVLIDFRGTIYKLRITKNDKLILNKP